MILNYQVIVKVFNFNYLSSKILTAFDREFESKRDFDSNIKLGRHVKNNTQY